MSVHSSLSCAVAGFELPDHRPVRAAHAHHLADLGTLELAQHAAADDQLAQARGEVAPGDDLAAVGRSVKAAGSTPRTVMLAPLLLSSLRTSSAITITSAEASGFAVGAGGDARLLLDDVGLVAVRARN